MRSPKVSPGDRGSAYSLPDFLPWQLAAAASGWEEDPASWERLKAGQAQSALLPSVPEGLRLGTRRRLDVKPSSGF